MSERRDWKLVIHGGAGVIERSEMGADQEARVRSSLDAVLKTGSAILSDGGSALDAVEAAVRALEDDPNFNAGRGSVLTWDRTFELDASIMDGRDRSAGAVAGVSATRNPVTLARTVMEKSDHVFLGGAGAEAFARDQGIEQVPPSYFETEERKAQLEHLRTRGLKALEVEFKYGTVGAAALDSQGHVAAATSTGGLTGKRWGRIGDSPVIGAGVWADDRSCAISCTGSGEFFIRVGVAHEIAARIRHLRENAQAAADAVIAELGALGGSGGVILLTPKGETIFAFNSSGMYRGLASAEGRRVAIYRDE